MGRNRRYTTGCRNGQVESTARSLTACITLFLMLPLLSFAADTAEGGAIEGRLEVAVEEIGRAAREESRSGAGPKVVALGTLTYSDTGIGSEFSAYLGQKLRAALRDSPRFQVSDSDNLDEVMEQMKIALSGLADETGGPEIGKLKSATALLEGRYHEEGSDIVLSLELTEVETGLSIAGEELRLARRDIPADIALLPANYQDAMEVVGELSGIEFIKVIASTRQFEDIEEAFSDLGSAEGRVLTRGLAVKQKDELRTEEMISYTIVE